MKTVIYEFTKIVSKEKDFAPLKTELFKTFVSLGLLQKIQTGEMSMDHCSATSQDELAQSIISRLEIISQKTHEFLSSEGTDQHHQLLDPYLNQIDEAIATEKPKQSNRLK